MPTQPASSEVTHNLFRFLHLKSPGLIKSANLGSSFISASSTTSQFLDNIEGITDPQEVQDTVESTITSLTFFGSYKEVKSLSTNFYEFSEWLSENRKNLEYAEVTSKVSGVSRLTLGQIESVWDNLFYQAIRNNSSAIREACMKVLIADNFHSAFETWSASNQEPTYTDVVKADFEKKAGASVIIPSILLTKPEDEPASDTAANAAQNDVLIKHHLAEIGRHNVRRMITAVSELEKAASIYEQLTDIEFHDAYNTYLAQVKQAYEAATPTPDPDTGEILYPDLVEPTFSFTPSNDQMSSQFLTDKVSKDTLGILNEIKTQAHASIRDVIRSIEARIDAEQDIILSNVAAERTVVTKNGAKISANPRPRNNSYVITSRKLYSNDDLYTFYVTQYFENEDSRMTGLEITGTVNELGFDDYTSSKDYFINTTDHYTTVQLFREGLEIEGGGDIEIPIDLLYDAADISLSETVSISLRTGRDQAGQIGGNAQESWEIPEVEQYGVTRIGIGEFKRVEQYLCCYIEGEVSHIENILAREYKEKAARNLTRTELVTEETEEREVENLTDTTTTDRYEMQSEISNVIEENKSKDFGASASVNGDLPIGGSFTTSANFASSFSSGVSSSFSEAESAAKEITEQALERIVRKTSTKRTSRMLREFEESNKHGFDNREGTEHVVGIYRWVDKVYENKLVNYGKRLMYEFMIPEPAKNFIYWLTKNASKGEGISVVAEKPIPLAVAGLSKPEDLNRWNYAKIAGLYGAQVEPCPDREINVGKAFSKDLSASTPDHEDSGLIKGSFDFEVEIPDGYKCTYVVYQTGVDRHGKGDWTASYTIARLQLHIGSRATVARENTFSWPGSAVTIEPVEKALPVSGRVVDVSQVSVNIDARCILKTDVYEAWRSEAYAAILDAYNKKMQAYNDAIANQPAESSEKPVTDLSFNPLKGRAIEKRELKRAALEMVTKPFGFGLGRYNFDLNPYFDYYTIDQSAGFQKYASHVKFLEQAFDWELMAYILYPYYWADITGWKDSHKNTSSSDFIFESFLQSGMARMVVPVRLGFESAVLMYMDTGIIWEGNGYVLDDPNDLYLSIHDELQVAEGEVEAIWSTRVPTSLTIVQKDAAALNREGLPCYCEDGTPIATGSSIMSGIDNSKLEPTCLELQASATAIDASRQTHMDNFTANGTEVCSEVLDGLNELETELEELIDQATSLGCETTGMLAIQSQLDSDIITVDGTCNPE